MAIIGTMTSGLTGYFTVRKSVGEIYDTTVLPYHSTNSWLTWNNSDVANYDIALVHKGGDMYVGCN